MRTSVLFAVALVSASTGSVFAADWPHWLGPNRDGISGERLPGELRIPDASWSAEIGIGFSSFAVAEGRVFTMGHRDGEEIVRCLSEKDGSVLWKHSYPAELMPNLHEGGPGASPTVDGDRVFTLSKDGLLHAFEAGSGKVLWSRDLHELSGLRRPPEWGYTGSPLVQGELVMVEAGATFAFEKTSGEPRWRSEDYRPAYGTSQPFAAGGKSFLATLKTDGLVILDPGSGETLGFEMWRTSFQTNSTTPLDAGGGRLFVSTGYDRGCALFRFDGATLTKVYENGNMCNHMGNSVLLDGYLYGFDGTAHRGRPVEFTCIDLERGEKRWHFPDLKYGSVVGVGKDLVVLTETGELLVGAASPDGFEPRARRQILSGRCWTPPVFANGVLYARNATGTMVAVPLR